MRFFRQISFLAVLMMALKGLPVEAVLNNSVRVDDFDWMMVQTEHFDIYYDKDSELLVPRMAHYLEKAWKDVGNRLDYQVTERTPFFFYSNHNTFEQTNIVRIGEGTGGVTEAFKNRFVIFNNGSETWMKHVIYHEFAHVVQFNVLYGGFWKSIRLLKSPFYPLWMMEGMAEYVTTPIDASTREMIIRDAVYHDILVPLTELQGFAHLKPNQITPAYKTGTAAMIFLAEEYGEEKVGELLTTMKDHFDVSSALDNLLGIDIHRFDFRFREYLQDKYADFFKEAHDPTHYAEKITGSDALPQSNYGLVFSKTKDVFYFFSDRKGLVQLYEYDLQKAKARTLVNLKWGKFENIHPRGRSLSVSEDGRWLAFAGEKKQRDFLYLFDLKKKKLKKIKVPFDQIRTPVFSPVQDQLVCVGMVNGYNDLYLIDREGKIVKRLTNSPQDEVDPVFDKSGEKIIFSGEVLSSDGADPMGRNLFELDTDTSEVRTLTALTGDEMDPEILSDGNILFVRNMDDQGRLRTNLYKLNVRTGEIKQMTNVIGGAFLPRWNEKTNSLYFVGFSRGERHVYRWMKSEDSPALAKIDSNSDFGDPPHRKDQYEIHRSQLTWPTSGTSSLFLEAAQPYRLKASTDLFLPFFFYSTQEGLVVADIWQFSDYLGNHRVQQQMQYASGNDFIDFAAFYTYAGFRPQFTFGFRNEQYYRDLDEQRQRREKTGIGLATYPLDRVNAVSVGVGATDKEDRFLDDSDIDTNLRERFWLAGIAHDTITGRYLVPTRGRRLSLFYQTGVDQHGGNQQYRTGAAEAVQYIPLPRESTLAARLFYGRSVGSEPQVFRLGGVDRVRGVSRRSLTNKKTNAAIASGEIRLRLKYLHARTKFLFPDFFFKAAYLTLFDDVGYGWDNQQERDAFEVEETVNSAGAGITWPTFILQSFQINLTVLWARRTDIGTDVWYIALGPNF